MVEGVGRRAEAAPEGPEALGLEPVAFAPGAATVVAPAVIARELLPTVALTSHSERRLAKLANFLQIVDEFLAKCLKMLN